MGSIPGQRTKIPHVTWQKEKQTKTRDVLESERSKIKMPADSVCAETSLPDSLRANFWPCPHMAVRELSEISWH